MEILLMLVAFMIAAVGGIYVMVVISDIFTGHNEFAPEGGTGWFFFIIALVIVLICSVYVNKNTSHYHYESDVPGCRSC